MKSTTRAGVIGAALLMAMGAVAPAQAARQTASDTANDVVKMTCATNDCTSYAQTAQPTRVEGDIRSIVTNHTTTSVVVRVGFGDLYPYKQDRFLDIALRTNEGIAREAVAYYNADAPSQGYRFLLKTSTGALVDCAGLSAKADYTANSITVTVPRTCLSNPLSVRTGAIYARFPGGVDSTDPFYADDARLSGKVPQNAIPTVGTAVAKG